MAPQTPHQHSHEVAYSAGGVCYRLADGEAYVVLIATNGRTRWGLPKGHVSTDEAPADAARREVLEETGIDGTVLHLIETIEYWFRARRGRVHKFVDFFLLRYDDGEVVPQEAEVDDAQWFLLNEAIRLATFPRERAILEHVRDLWQQGQLSE